MNRSGQAGGVWALDELDRVMRGDAIASRSGCRPGGEWDALRALPVRVRRRLLGAGYLRPGGLEPDVAADLIASQVPGVGSVDAAIEWYVRTCLAAIAEARTDAGRRRRAQLARRGGHSTYYAYRSEWARDRGHQSVWHMRRDRGWAA
ncbi:MAG TPA: hypothetical protein VNQ73_16660 [Ilumatobacter sp.]|nr:hypothetical protein [Ilumatobacter sp.]